MATSTSTPPAATTLLGRLANHTSTTPNKVALTFLDIGPNGGTIQNQLTYKQITQQTSALAESLLSKGLQTGDRAVLVYMPSLDFILAFIACIKVGIVAVPVFPPNPNRKDTLFMFSRIVASCGANYALTSASYSHVKKLSSLKDAFTNLTKSTTNATWPQHLKWFETDSMINTKLQKFPSVDAFESKYTDLAFLQFTSGSTSEPKGVMITHGNLSDNLYKITNELKAKEDTVVVSWLPQYHDMGLIGSYLGTLYCGGEGYYMSPLTFLQRPLMWIEAISRFKATHLQAPNFAFKLTARKFDASKYVNESSKSKSSNPTLNLGSVRHIINAAEPVTEESIDAFMKAFCPYGLRDDVMFPTYGLAEHTVFVCSGGKQRLTVSKKDLEVDGIVKELTKNNDSVDSSNESRLIGCGFPKSQNVDVRIVNVETMKEVGENIVGEIWIRSASKAAGYFNKPVESRHDFCAKIGVAESDVKTSDANYDPSEGYLRSGDLGFLHNRELFICGRMKDLIIIGGRNYYPQDIEMTAEASSPLLRPGCSAAFTVDPMNKSGEEVAMVLEVKEVPNGKENEKICSDIIYAVKSSVNQEHSLTLSHVILLRPRTIPKTTSGKIARAWCRKAFIAKSLETIYTKSFRTSVRFIESENVGDHTKTSSALRSNRSGSEIRRMEKSEIMKMLKSDISLITSMDPKSIPTDAAFVTFLDSLSISQFKGLLDSHYGTRISDEYLFLQGTTLEKMVEVVKRGYAPDDPLLAGGSLSSSSSPQQEAMATTHESKGVAGALGCPPGVCCVIM